MQPSPSFRECIFAHYCYTPCSPLNLTSTFHQWLKHVNSSTFLCPLDGVECEIADKNKFLNMYPVFIYIIQIDINSTSVVKTWLIQNLVWKIQVFEKPHPYNKFLLLNILVTFNSWNNFVFRLNRIPKVFKTGSSHINWDPRSCIIPMIQRLEQ